MSRAPKIDESATSDAQPLHSSSPLMPSSPTPEALDAHNAAIAVDWRPDKSRSWLQHAISWAHALVWLAVYAVEFHHIWLDSQRSDADPTYRPVNAVARFTPVFFLGIGAEFLIGLVQQGKMLYGPSDTLTSLGTGCV